MLFSFIVTINDSTYYYTQGYTRLLSRPLWGVNQTIKEPNAQCTEEVDIANLPMAGIGKLKSIAEWLEWVVSGRPENKNLLIANGCFWIVSSGRFVS